MGSCLPTVYRLDVLLILHKNVKKTFTSSSLVGSTSRRKNNCQIIESTAFIFLCDKACCWSVVFVLVEEFVQSLGAECASVG